MPISIAIIITILPINDLDTLPRLIISGLVGLIVGGEQKIIREMEDC